MEPDSPGYHITVEVWLLRNTGGFSVFQQGFAVASATVTWDTTWFLSSVTLQHKALQPSSNGWAGCAREPKLNCEVCYPLHYLMSLTFFFLLLLLFGSLLSFSSCIFFFFSVCWVHPLRFPVLSHSISLLALSSPTVSHMFVCLS